MDDLLIHAAGAGLAGVAFIYGVALAGAVLHYYVTILRNGAPVSLPGFGAHLFPRSLLCSRWTRMDVSIYIINKALSGLVLPAIGAAVVVIASLTRAGLSVIDSPPDWLAHVAMAHHTLVMAGFLACGLLLRDFVAFYIHVLQHRVPLLWEFHKVHHAPESLIPLTGYRLHPLELLANVAAESPLLGVLAGFFGWVTSQDEAKLIVSSVGLYIIVNVLTFAPLRHSHIDLRLGPLERILLSPAHHHLHHSVEPHHWDKNFGTIFPLWDWWWNTLAVPPTAPDQLGLPGRTSEDYASVWKAFVTPLGRLRHCRWRDLRVNPLARHMQSRDGDRA